MRPPRPARPIRLRRRLISKPPRTSRWPPATVTWRSPCWGWPPSSPGPPAKLVPGPWCWPTPSPWPTGFRPCSRPRCQPASCGNCCRPPRRRHPPPTSRWPPPRPSPGPGTAGPKNRHPARATARPWTARAKNDSPGPQLAAQALAAARRSADPVLISGALDAAAAAARDTGALRRRYPLIQERGVLLDQLPRDDPRAGAEIVDTLRTAADGAVQAGDLPAALASARHGRGDSILSGQPDLAAGIAVVPLVLQGEFDEAVSQAALMWEAWERDRETAARWVLLGGYAALLAHSLRGDEAARRLWQSRVNELSARGQAAADLALTGFATFTDARGALQQGRLGVDASD